LLSQTQTWLEDNITPYNNYVNDHSYTNEQYQNLQNQITSLQSQISSLSSQVTSLQNQVNDLTSSLNLSNSKVWISSQTVSSPANSYYSWAPLRVDYAGYVSVNVESSTSTHTYVHTIYSSNGVNYDQLTFVGHSGTVFFPVLPTQSLGIYVGATNEASTVTVTITYHY
jgi:hypothetical protein